MRYAMAKDGVFFHARGSGRSCALGSQRRTPSRSRRHARSRACSNVMGLRSVVSIAKLWRARMWYRPVKYASSPSDSLGASQKSDSPWIMSVGVDNTRTSWSFCCRESCRESQASPLSQLQAVAQVRRWSLTDQHRSLLIPLTDTGVDRSLVVDVRVA